MISIDFYLLLGYFLSCVLYNNVSTNRKNIIESQDCDIIVLFQFITELSSYIIISPHTNNPQMTPFASASLLYR